MVKFSTEQRVTDNLQSINFKVTSNMVPSARLVVYYILSGEERAELVADSVWFNVKAKCVNNLDVIFYYIISFIYFMKMINGQRTTRYIHTVDTLAVLYKIA